MEKTVINYFSEIGKEMISDGLWKTISEVASKAIKYLKEEIKRELQEEQE